MTHEKVYLTKDLIERLNNALENGYEELGATDIGDLLLECEIAPESDQEWKEDEYPRACNHEFVQRPPHGYLFCRFCNCSATIVGTITSNPKGD
jgi:hypothetical protein